VIIVSHRINTKKELIKLKNQYGVEIDLRTYGKDIVVNHDPFYKSIKFSTWLKFYNHKLLIANIKEEGIEKEVIKLIKKNSIVDYFLLDVTIPQILNLNKIKILDIGLRISKYEQYKGILNFKHKNKWIWLDTFDGELPIKINEIKNLKNMNYKICLVSPELPLKKKLYTKKFITTYKNSLSFIDAVCTKQPNLWKNFQ